MKKRIRAITSMIVTSLFSFTLLGVNSTNVYGAGNTQNDKQFTLQSSNGTKTDNGQNKKNGDDSIQNDKLWTLKWSDEFKSEKVNTDNWNYEIGNGTGGWGNNELEYYTDNTQNVYIDKTDKEASNGKLVIKAIKENLPGVTQNYTSGRITTKGKVSMKYGRLDIRAKLPAGEGLWPALWLMPKDDKYGGWAASGEIDMMEARGRLTDRVSGTLHYGQSWPNNIYSGKEFVFPQGQSTNQYHVYSLEWEPGEIRWYVDGKLYQTQTNWFTKGTNGEEKYSFPAPFDQDFFIIMNLAVGGNFDSQADLTKTQFPAQMDVDYVRVFDLTGRPYKTVTEPLLTPAPLPADAKQPDTNGNYLSNGNFTDPIVDNSEGANDFGTAWNFVHITAAAGNGTQSIETINSANYAKINVTAAGTQNYAVQLIQRTTMGMGRWYRLAFDAKADSERAINVKACGGSDRGYTSYSDLFTYDLGTDFKHYESTFQMTKDTDLIGRLEFELGLKTSTVWIGNVSLVEIPAPIVDYNASKAPLPVSENLVYNGAFDKGLISRMTYWNVNSSAPAKVNVYVPESTRELNVDVTNGGKNTSAITVDQKGIQLQNKNDYRLTFTARAAAARTMKVKIASKDGITNYVPETSFDLTTETKTIEVPFKMNNATDLESQLVFMLGGNSSDVYIDNVSLVKTSVDYTGVELYPLKNGSFAQDYIGWERFTQGADAVFTMDNGAAKISASTVGTDAWNIMLMQNNMNLTKGIDYTLSFKAKASINRDMLVTLENATYNRTFDSGSLPLTSDWQTFTYTVRPALTEVLGLKFQLGKTAAAAPGDIYIDDVVLQVKNPPYKQAPILIADVTDNKVGSAVDIATADDSVWRSAITAVKINETAVPTGKYTLSAGNINLAADNFTAEGSYTIKVEADGYVSTSVVQSILANDGNLVQNGRFTTDVSGWTTYSNGAITAASLNGEAKIDINGFGTNPWDVQFSQNGFNFEPNVKYTISFKARASVARSFGVDIEGAGYFRYLDMTDNLSTEMKTYTYEFTITKAETTKLNFFFGKTGDDITDAIRTAAHTIYIDDVVINKTSNNGGI